MSDTELFMHIDPLGNLYICDVILSYIYPRVFVCQNRCGQKYLFYEMDAPDDKEIWLVCKTTKSEYDDLKNHKKPIQRAYDEKNENELFSITKIGEKISLAMDGKNWLSHLPEQPVYAEDCLA